MTAPERVRYRQFIFSSATVRLLAILVTAVLLALHVAAVAVVLPSALDHDEGEYLHASWLMNHGKRIYRDFMEDHPPYLFQLLDILQPSARTPEFPLLDVRLWAVRSRVLMVIFGTIAVLSTAGVVARATRNGIAGLLTLAALLGSTSTWVRGIVQIRPDAPTLMLYWSGVLLLLWDDDDDRGAALRCGAGMALVVAAEIWNPKWPLCGLVVGFFFLRRLVRGVRSAKSNAVLMVAPSAIVGAIFIALTVSVTTLRDYLYFNFILKSANMGRFRTAPWVVSIFKLFPPFVFTSTIERPAVVLVLFLGAAFLLTRNATRLDASIDRIAIAEVLGIMVASAIEVRFVYTYPYLWPQYYLMWSFAAAALLGIVFALMNRVFASVAVSLLGISLALLVGLAGPLIARPTDPEVNRIHWGAVSFMQQTLAPNETVWMTATLHPIAVFDASYFWYSPLDLIPDTLGYIHDEPKSREYLPQISERDLPPCRIADGFPSTLRYTLAPLWIRTLPNAARCTSQLATRGLLRPTPFTPIFEAAPSVRARR